MPEVWIERVPRPLAEIWPHPARIEVRVVGEKGVQGGIGGALQPQPPVVVRRNLDGEGGQRVLNSHEKYYLSRIQ